MKEFTQKIGLIYKSIVEKLSATQVVITDIKGITLERSPMHVSTIKKHSTELVV